MAARVTRATSRRDRDGYRLYSVSLKEDERLDCSTVGPVLLIGVSGGTGRSVVSGFLLAGVSAGNLVVLTRNPQSDAVKSLLDKGLRAVQGDLDDAASLQRALEGVAAVYIHGLSKDAAKADTKEVERGNRLAAACKQAKVLHVVYNSSGGRGAKAAVSHMDQKHKVEDLFREAGVPTTNLQATMFMEELWKRYTRPHILKGKYPFSLPSDRPMQMVAVRDMGYAAGLLLSQPQLYIGKSIEIAGDELTPKEMCEAFTEAQGGSPVVVHSCPPAWLLWFISGDLYRIVVFLQTTGYKANIEECRQAFPGILTFDDFLHQTHWGDRSRTYEDGVDY